MLPRCRSIRAASKQPEPRVAPRPAPEEPEIRVLADPERWYTAVVANLRRLLAGILVLQCFSRFRGGRMGVPLSPPANRDSEEVLQNQAFIEPPEIMV